MPGVRSSADQRPPPVCRWQPTWMFSSTDQVLEELRKLEGPDQARGRDRLRRAGGDVVAGEYDTAGIGRLEARDQVEQRGLAGAVRADDGGDAALGYIQVDGIDRDQAAEAARDVLYRQERHGPLRRAMRSPSEASPFGA